MLGADPFDHYQRSLAEQPVMSMGSNTWLVTGAEQVQEICSRPEGFSSDISSLIAGQHHTDPDVAAVIAQGWPQVQVLLMSDPPDHSRFRQMVNMAFTSKRVSAIENGIRTISSQLLKTVKRGQAWDFIEAYAVPLPVAVIAQELGLPSDMRQKVRLWSDAFTDQLGGMIDKPRAIECAQCVVDFQHAMKEQIDRRREQPSNDLLSDLVTASDETSQPLSTAELLSIAQQLMVAGNETSTSTMAEGLKLLIQHPDQLALLRADPTLIRNAAEEILRLAAPVAGSWRIASEATQLAGQPIAKGDRIMVRFAAASRDPSLFDQPDTLNLERRNARRHFAFGRGIHTCVGNLLARRELAIMLEHMMEQFQSIELAVAADELSYKPNAMLRGLSALPIQVD